VKVTLPAARQILIEREFAAPAAMVWRAVTEPELVRRWWHAGRGEMTVCEIDLRVGGTWRYAMRPGHGEEFAFYGEFLEIVTCTSAPGWKPACRTRSTAWSRWRSRWPDRPPPDAAP